MKNVTIGTAVSIKRAIERFNEYNLENPIQLTAKISYALYKNLNLLNKAEEYFTEENKRLLTKYGKKDKDGNLEIGENNMVNIPKLEEYNKELKEVIDLDSGIELHKIDVDIDKLAENIEGKQNVLNLLWALLEELQVVKEVKEVKPKVKKVDKVLEDA